VQVVVVELVVRLALGQRVAQAAGSLRVEV
jgi:hypothetical protein